MLNVKTCYLLIVVCISSICDRINAQDNQIAAIYVNEFTFGDEKFPEGENFKEICETIISDSPIFKLVERGNLVDINSQVDSEERIKDDLKSNYPENRSYLGADYSLTGDIKNPPFGADYYRIVININTLSGVEVSRKKTITVRVPYNQIRNYTLVDSLIRKEFILFNLNSKDQFSSLLETISSQDSVIASLNGKVETTSNKLAILSEQSRLIQKIDVTVLLAFDTIVAAKDVVKDEKLNVKISGILAPIPDLNYTKKTNEIFLGLYNDNSIIYNSQPNVKWYQFTLSDFATNLIDMHLTRLTNQNGLILDHRDLNLPKTKIIIKASIAVNGRTIVSNYSFGDRYVFRDFERNQIAIDISNLMEIVNEKF